MVDVPGGGRLRDLPDSDQLPALDPAGLHRTPATDLSAIAIEPWYRIRRDLSHPGAPLDR